MIDPINLILIILSALSVIFTLFLCFIAIAAFLGWRGIRDFEIKRKEFLLRQEKTFEETKKEINLIRQSANKLIGELKKQKIKIKKPADFKKYEKRTEELINKLEGSLERAENRISDLRISGISSSSSIVSSPTASIITGGDHISTNPFEKKCIICGKTYIDEKIGLFSKCPFCGHDNY